MGFLSGRASFERYRVDGAAVRQLNDAHLETLKEFAADKIVASSAEEAHAGFLAGRHLFDVDFRLEKNVIADVLHAAIRLDTNKIPSALRKAWLEIELAALLAESESGRLTKAARQEAKEAVEARCVEEASDGRFRRMQQFPFLWDVRNNVVFLGTSSPVASDLGISLLEQAFDFSLERITAGKLAQQVVAESDKALAVDDIAPSDFQSQGEGEIAWLNGAMGNGDFLGNELLLWLWWFLDTQSDTIPLADGSEAVGMLNRTLSLECPRGESGKESITSESPVRLPEAMQAIRTGKLPRKSGIVLVRQGLQHEFVLQAESLAVSGAKIALAEDEGDGPTADEARVEGLRNLVETIDLVFAAFCQRRLSRAWKKDLTQIQGWLGAEPIAADAKATGGRRASRRLVS